MRKEQSDGSDGLVVPRTPGMDEMQVQLLPGIGCFADHSASLDVKSQHHNANIRAVE
ncbi:hypothetical protein KIN20_032138 [Parelaphostrongylus tenuis]|uniref:Uncharacterized protein n=1 Tax=Parelaphostrongylus tenuis TaxID=148309 RepID=A0AAD5R6R1_PARTN|nr:hypothetical protein KIN20_032138 [Parelaphostrongylus tenuis]